MTTSTNGHRTERLQRIVPAAVFLLVGIAYWAQLSGVAYDTYTQYPALFLISPGLFTYIFAAKDVHMTGGFMMHISIIIVSWIVWTLLIAAVWMGWAFCVCLLTKRRHSGA
jgi:hypothetical protein